MLEDFIEMKYIGWEKLQREKVDQLPRTGGFEGSEGYLLMGMCFFLG